MESLPPFLTEEQTLAIRDEFGTPVYVYDQRALASQAQKALDCPNAFGLTVRFAMKALPNAAVLQLFNGLGLHIDASSEFEVKRAMAAGIPPQHIQLTAQQLASDLAELLDSGVLFTACSLYQLDAYGKHYPGTEVCVRINPGSGSGHSNRTNTGGLAASFGVWLEHLDELFDLQRAHNFRITRMHTHIGSGSDPEKWHECAQLSLGIAAQLPDVHTLSLGGGFKVGRMSNEQDTDLHAVGERVKTDFEAFAEKHGRRLHLEIEPGTYLVANAGAVICTVIDVVDTGASGYNFIKVDSGMTEVTRPSMYGAQHPIAVVPASQEDRGTKDYIVAGHCCESGDVLTPATAEPEELAPRPMLEARIGDALVIGGAGAYCAAMSTKNYNSFPEAAEVLIDENGTPRLIRKRQTLDQITANEV